MNKLSSPPKTILEIPKTTEGFKSFLKSLHHPARKYSFLKEEPLWSSNYLFMQKGDTSITLEEFDYNASEIHSYNGVKDNLCLHGPFRFLTVEGINKLTDVCKKLRVHAKENDYVITNRTRGAQRYSEFIYDMIRDKDFLLMCSRLVGVPLIPHPLRDATVQVNYYSPDREANKREEGKWHYDGMDYVFTMLLTDKEEFDGGEYVYYKNRKDMFLADPDREKKMHYSSSKKGSSAELVGEKQLRLA